MAQTTKKHDHYVEYKDEHFDTIFKHWVNDPKRCVKETGHPESSIKFMLHNAVRRLEGIHDTALGTQRYADKLTSYLEANPRFNKPMSLELFKAKFL